LDRLRRSGIHAVLDYAAEDDVSEPARLPPPFFLPSRPAPPCPASLPLSRAVCSSQLGRAGEEGPQSRQPAVASAVARTYSYEDEAACDRRMAHFLTSIDAAASQGGQGFAAIKVSALGLPSLLERASAALTAIRGLFSQLDANGDGWLEAAEFRAEYSRLFKDDGADRMDQVFAHLDTNRDGRVDYLSFAERVSVYDGAAIAARCRQEGPFSRAALSPAELRLLDATLRRVHALAAAAAGRGVRLMVDAEQSSMQPAIDAIVAALQREHNRERAAVFGTYQCYLADAPARLALDLERARRGGYLFGAKLVRGAYMHLERRRAEAAGAPSPVWGSAGETHAAYDAAVATMLPRVREQGAEVMVATHNKASVERAVAGMAAEGLQPSAPVYFGQLFGMADHLTYALGQNGFRAYKYVPFGPIDEVLPYLVRRAQENSDVLGGAGREAALGAAALRRRLRWRV
jgi:proline dehydrogenase